MMNRVHDFSFRLLIGFVLLLLCFAGEMQAQTPPPQQSTKPADAKAAQKKAEDDQFAIQPAPPLPAGMTGSDANDPRAKLKPGMYDAGEVAKGLNHVLLLKKPDPFQLDSAHPDDPK